MKKTGASHINIKVKNIREINPPVAGVEAIKFDIVTESTVIFEPLWYLMTLKGFAKFALENPSVESPPRYGKIIKYAYGIRQPMKIIIGWNLVLFDF